MRRAFALWITVLMIGLIAAVDGWKRNQKYNFRVITKAQTPSYNEKWSDDDALQSRLSIRSVNDDILIGQFSRAEYAKVGHKDLPLDKPFKVELRNGGVDALYVDPDLTIPEIFQLKFMASTIVNQCRVDTDSVTMDGKSTTFSRNETTTTAVGQCETTYEISPMSEVLARSRPDLVPLPELRGHGIFLDVIKTRDYNNCNKRTNFTQNPMSSTALIEVTHIILSGTLDDFTVQSSVTDIKSADILNTSVYNIFAVNLTLDSIETNSEYSSLSDEHFVNVDKLLASNTISGALDIAQILEEKPDKRWSGCFNRVASADSLCHSAFGAEWETVKIENCGFLESGRTALCERKYPGCESTACFSFFMQNLCDARLPVHKGGFVDCAPGLWRWRCCPN